MQQQLGQVEDAVPHGLGNARGSASCRAPSGRHLNRDRMVSGGFSAPALVMAALGALGRAAHERRKARAN